MSKAFIKTQKPRFTPHLRNKPRLIIYGENALQLVALHVLQEGFSVHKTSHTSIWNMVTLTVPELNSW